MKTFKKLLFLTVLIFASISIEAQESYNIRVYIHILTEDNGSGGLTESEIDTALSNMSQQFNPFDIYFAKISTQSHTRTQATNTTQEFGNHLFSVDNHNNGVDIYFLPRDINRLGYNGQASQDNAYPALWIESQYNDDTSVTTPPFKLVAQSTVLSHEMGHVLGLLHPEDTTTTCDDSTNIMIGGHPLLKTIGFIGDCHDIVMKSFLLTTLTHAMASYNTSPSVPCFDILEIHEDDYFDLNQFGKASQTITAYNTISPGKQDETLYDAGESITFKLKFHAEYGSRLLTSIYPINSCSSTSGKNSKKEEGQLTELPTATPISSIYPNPTTGFFNIETEEVITQYTIANSVGKQFVSKNVNNTTKLTLDIANLPNGIYFIRLQLNNGETINRKVIKQ